MRSVIITIYYNNSLLHDYIRIVGWTIRFEHSERGCVSNGINQLLMLTYIHIKHNQRLGYVIGKDRSINGHL